MRVRIIVGLGLSFGCVPDAAPRVGGVSLEPLAPTTEDPVTAVATGVLDPDGDEVELRFSWTVNGDPVEADGDTLPASRFSRGDTLIATAVPFDGEQEGAPVSSAPVTVVNARPVLRSVSITPDDPTSSDTLGAEVFSDDADGDPVTLTWTWWVDGEASGSDSTLPPPHPRGSVIELEVVASDGDAVSEPVISEAIVTANGAPPVPPPPLLTADSSWVPSPLTCTVQPVVDPDGDAVGYAVEFAVDGIVGDRVQATDGVATVSRLGTARGGSWTCRVRAEDSEGASSEWSAWSEAVDQDCNEDRIAVSALRSVSLAYSDGTWWEDGVLRAYEYDGGLRDDIVAYLAFDLADYGALAGVAEATLVLETTSAFGSPELVVVQTPDTRWVTRSPTVDIERTGTLTPVRRDFTGGDTARLSLNLSDWTDGPAPDRLLFTIGIDNVASAYSYVYFRGVTDPKGDPRLELTVCR